MPLPHDQAPFASAKIVLRKAHQRLDQLGEASAASGGNPELGHWPTLGIDRRGTWPDEIDLVAHQPDRRRAVIFDRRACGVGEPQHEIRLPCPRPRTSYAFL